MMALLMAVYISDLAGFVLSSMPFCIASFAVMSAILLPGIPTRDGIHSI